VKPIEQFFEEIEDKLKEEVQNLDQTHPKLMILFSGIPGSGKSFYAKAAEEEFRGVRISSERVRILLQEHIKPKYHYSTDWQEDFVANFLRYFIEKNCQINGLVILDKSIDRKFQETTSWAKNRGWKWLTIQIEASPEKLVERLKQKETYPKSEHLLDPKGYLENLPRWEKDHQNFISQNKTDLTIDNNREPQLQEVFDLIRSRI
jgi:predicted kinase